MNQLQAERLQVKYILIDRGICTNPYSPSAKDTLACIILNQMTAQGLKRDHLERQLRSYGAGVSRLWVHLNDLEVIGVIVQDNDRIYYSPDLLKN